MAAVAGCGQRWRQVVPGRRASEVGPLGKQVATGGWRWLSFSLAAVLVYLSMLYLCRTLSEVHVGLADA